MSRALDGLDAQVDTVETKKMLGGEHDAANAIVSIHPGAGGTESQDWAEMLLRMYLKWAERRGFKREILDYQPGEEAGLKSVTLTLTGEYAFGLMSAEAGVHRLVRISPFDQAARRHTSFASVYVWPSSTMRWRDRDSEKDLRNRHVRSSGAGASTSRHRLRVRLRTCRPASSSRARTTVAAQEQRRRDESVEGAALRLEAERAAGQAVANRRRQETSRSAARSAATCCSRIN